MNSTDKIKPIVEVKKTKSELFVEKIRDYPFMSFLSILFVTIVLLALLVFAALLFQESWSKYFGEPAGVLSSHLSFVFGFSATIASSLVAIIIAIAAIHLSKRMVEIEIDRDARDDYELMAELNKDALETIALAKDCYSEIFTSLDSLFVALKQSMVDRRISESSIVSERNKLVNDLKRLSIAIEQIDDIKDVQLAFERNSANVSDGKLCRIKDLLRTFHERDLSCETQEDRDEWFEQFEYEQAEKEAQQQHSDEAELDSDFSCEPRRFNDLDHDSKLKYNRWDIISDSSLWQLRDWSIFFREIAADLGLLSPRVLQENFSIIVYAGVVVPNSVIDTDFGGGFWLRKTLLARLAKSFIMKRYEIYFMPRTNGNLSFEGEFIASAMSIAGLRKSSEDSSINIPDVTHLLQLGLLSLAKKGPEIKRKTVVPNKNNRLIPDFCGEADGSLTLKAHAKLPTEDIWFNFVGAAFVLFEARMQLHAIISSSAQDNSSRHASAIQAVRYRQACNRMGYEVSNAFLQVSNDFLEQPESVFAPYPATGIFQNEPKIPKSFSSLSNFIKIPNPQLRK